MRRGLLLLAMVSLLSLRPATPASAQPPMFEPAAPGTVDRAWASPTRFDPPPAAPTESSADGDLSIVWQPQDVAYREYVLDPVRRRLVGFGGIDQSTITFTRQVWTVSLDGGGWSLLLAGGPGQTGPETRYPDPMIYDPVRDRVILFGGMTALGLNKNDVWALSLSGTPHWDSLATIGTPPKPRWGASGVYDPVRDRIVYFGGYDGETNDLYSNEIWELSLASSPPAWTLRSAQGPYPTVRARQFVAYDAAHDRMLMYGNTPSGDPADGQVWELQFSPILAWHVVPSSTSGPSPSDYPRMVFDTSRNRLLLMREDVWEFALSPAPHWTLLLSGSNAPANAVNAVYDRVGDRVVCANGPTAYQWSLGGPPAWTLLPGAPVAPTPRDGHAVALDAQHRMWVFGGASYTPSGHLDLNDVWALGLTGAPAWNAIAASGTAPSGRRGSALVYDAVGNRLIVFGGVRGEPSIFLNDVWALSLTGAPNWTQLTPSGPPPSPRTALATIYDPVGNRLVLFGGYNGTQPLLSDVWELRLGVDPPVWAPVSVACPCAPGPDYLTPRGFYDPVRHRMLVYLSSTSAPDQLWELALEPGYRWTMLTPTGTPPNLDSPGLEYDPQRDRLIAFSNEYWELSLGTTPLHWTHLNPTGPRPRYLSQGVIDAPRDRLVMFGGYGYVGPYAETWALSWGSPTVATPAERPVATLLEQSRPNPASDRVTFGYALAAQAQVRLEVLDVTGRRLITLVDRVMPAGHHEARWDLTSASGRRVGPGVYLYRLRSAGIERVRRLVTLR